MPQKQEMITIEVAPGKTVQYPKAVLDDPQALAKAQAEVLELRRQAGVNVDLPKPAPGMLGKLGMTTPPSQSPIPDPKQDRDFLHQLLSGVETVGPMLIPGMGASSWLLRGALAGSSGAADDLTSGRDIDPLRLALNTASEGLASAVDGPVRRGMNRLGVKLGGGTSGLADAVIRESERPVRVTIPGLGEVPVTGAPFTRPAPLAKGAVNRRLPKVGKQIEKMEQASKQTVGLHRLETGGPDAVVKNRGGASTPVSTGQAINAADRDFLIEQIAKRDAQNPSQEAQLLEYLKNPTTVRRLPVPGHQAAGFNPVASKPPSMQTVVQPRAPFSSDEIRRLAQQTPLSMEDLGEIRRVQGKEAQSMFESARSGEMISPMDQAVKEQLPAARAGLARDIQTEVLGPKFDDALTRYSDLKQLQGADSQLSGHWMARGPALGGAILGELAANTTETPYDNTMARLLFALSLLGGPRAMGTAGNMLGTAAKWAPTAFRGLRWGLEDDNDSR